jgi:cell division protein FtsL
VDSNLTTAIVTASGTTLVAIVAILSNNKRLDDTNSRLTRLEAKIDHLEQLLVSYALDVARLKEKFGM